jgi:hypothetical protein
MWASFLRNHSEEMFPGMKIIICRKNILQRKKQIHSGDIFRGLFKKSQLQAKIRYQPDKNCIFGVYL